MISGIQETIESLSRQNREAPAQELQQAIELLGKLNTIATQARDRETYLRINAFVLDLDFERASSSTGRSGISISIEKMRGLLAELKGTPIIPKRPILRFTDIRQKGPYIEEAPMDIDHSIVDNYLSIFEDPSRISNLDEITQYIDELGKTEGAKLAPMPPLTRCAIQGGGAKGAAYAGTYQAMDALGVTDTTKTFCGASAGAITSFLMGLGYDAQQFKAISDGMNFQDLADFNPSYLGAKFGGTVVSQIASVATQSHIFTGTAFHNWAKGQCALVFGDADITFSEMEQWYKERGLPVPEMIFMGTLVSPKGKGVTFSAHETPHIRIADAVRCSMSFPFAWDQFDARYGKSVKDKIRGIRDGDVFGRFADGGILNNYPIEELNTASENAAYAKPKCRDAIGTLVEQNPCSYGLSLSSSLSKLDEDITPATKRLKILKQKAHGHQIADESDDDFERRTANSKLKENKLWNLASVLKKNFLGDTATSIQDEKKRKIFDRQTAIIYTEGVGVLEFALTPHKMKLIEDSGKFAFINWYLKHRNPTLTYEDYFLSKNIGQGVAYNASQFEGEAVLHNEDIAKLAELKLEGKEAKAVEKYCRLMLDFHDELAMLRKVIALSQDPEIMEALTEEQKQLLAQFKDLNSNQRLKHLSWQIKQLELKYPILKSDRAALINKQVFEVVRAHAAQAKALKTHKKQTLDRNIDKLQVIAKIHALIDKDTENATKQAIDIFKGQMSVMFDLMMTDPSLLSNLASRCSPLQLEDLLENLRITAHQLDQQDRKWHGNFGFFNKLENETVSNFPTRFQLFMDQFTDPSLLENAILHRDKSKIDTILGIKSKGYGLGFGVKHYIDPLASNSAGKNALHVCVDADDFDTFEQIIVDLNPVSLPFEANGQNLLHYIIEKGNQDFISLLFSNPRTSEWVKAVIANASKSNPEFRAQFGSGESLREQIIRIGKQKDIDLDAINLVLKPMRPISGADIKIYNAENAAASDRQIEYYVQQFVEKDIAPENLSDFTPAQALRCLIQPTLAGKALIENAAENKSHWNLAKALIAICKKDPIVEASLKELYKVKFSGDSSLLYLAAVNDNSELVEECLANNVDINMAGSFHHCSSALTAAAKAGNFDVVEQIWKSKSNYSRTISDDEGKNPLHYLAQNPKCPAQLFVDLVSKGSVPGSARYLKVDVADNNGKTPFDYLVENNRLDVIANVIGKWHLDECFNIFHLRADGKTSLEYLVEKAAEDPSNESLKYSLLKKVSRAGLYESDSNGKTVLHHLANSPKEKISAEDFVHYFAKGAKTRFPMISIETTHTYQQLAKIEDSDANSVFRTILNNNRSDIIQYLRENWTNWNLNAIFDLNSIRSDGLSDYEYMMANIQPGTHPELHEQLNLALPDSMQRNALGIPRLHELVDGGSPDQIWKLLGAGLKTWSPTGLRESPEDYKAQTSVPDQQNRTLLRHIIENNRTDILDFLKEQTGSKLVTIAGGKWYLDHYFDMTSIGADGLSDLEFAFNKATPEMKSVLFSRLSPETQTTQFASTDSRGMTPLHYVASDPDIKIEAFWEIINRGQLSGDPAVYHGRTNVEDSDGTTPFRLLIEHNRIDVLKNISTHCGGRGWWFDHYINLSVQRQDGMNDLEYLLFKAQTTPALKAFVELVKKNTSTAVFKEASESVVQNSKRFEANVAEIAERKAPPPRVEDGLKRPKFKAK